MRTLILLSIISSIFYLSACEKVIDLELRDADKRLVVDASITDDSGSCRVTLSRVVNYSESNTPDRVSNASVKLTDNGVEYSLFEIEPGVYSFSNLTGIPGHTYTLNIIADGEEYTATSVMPQRVEIDTLYLSNEVFFVDTNLSTNFEFQDPAGIVNYYRYVFQDSDTDRVNISVDDDTFFDGELAEQNFISFDDNNVSGDTISVELWAIDKAVHKYFLTLDEIITGQTGQLAAPANPSSNISNGALGYFSAHTVSKRTVIVP